jgi:heat shock protein HslJ
MQFRAAGSVPSASPTPIVVTVAPTQALTQAPPTVAPPTNTPPPACAGLPQIDSFVADPATIVRGQNSVLRWGSVSNADTVVIDQGIGGVATPGNAVIAPERTTTYIMTAVGCGGPVQASVTVVVLEPTAPPVVAPTAIPTQPPTELPGLELSGLWRWTGTRLQDGSTVAPPNPNQYTINFHIDGTAPIQADCNEALARWSVSGDRLSINIVSQTRAECGSDSLSDQYLQWLGQANTYSVQGAILAIDLALDSGRMTLSR